MCLLIHWVLSILGCYRDATGPKQACGSTFKCLCSNSTLLCFAIAYLTVLVGSSLAVFPHCVLEMRILLIVHFMAAADNCSVWLHGSRCGIYPVTRRQWLAVYTNCSGVSTFLADCFRVLQLNKSSHWAHIVGNKALCRTRDDSLIEIGEVNVTS